MEDNATTNFNLEMTEEPVTPEVNPTASTEGKTNGVKTGDLVASFSVLLILVALVVSVVLLLKRKRKLFIFEKRRRKITSGIIMTCTAASVLGFGSIAYAATNYDGWYDRQVQEIQEFNEVYNDGLLKVTTKIEGIISPKTGNVTCDNKICLTNLSDSGNIKINNVKAVKNSGFEDANIDSWTIKNYRQTLFDGDSATEYVPNVTLEKNTEVEFSVTTKLSGQEAIDLNNTTPFNFVYDYKYVERKLNYMVSIWGIEEDKVYDEHHMAGLSFGPATGYSAECLSLNGSADHGHVSGGHCICEDSWEEIIENCNNGNWEIYSNCLNYGCAKAVEITENPDLFPMKPAVYEYSFSNFYNLINRDYTYNNMWHDDKSSSLANCESANWATSRLRATYNGYDEEGSNFAPSIYAYAKGEKNDCLTSSNCFLSCFPECLRQSIVPKYYRVASSWDLKNSPHKILEYTDVSDKLWAPGLSEVWGEGGQDVNLEYGEFQYSKMEINGVTWGSEQGRYAVTWDSVHTKSHSWLSSPAKSENYLTCALNANGFMAAYNSCSPSPYFCLGCREISLDDYGLENLTKISKTIAKFGGLATFVNEFKDYQAEDKIWWSNSHGYFDSLGYTYASAISNEDVSHCNQNYKNNFTDASGNLCEERNRFVFLRILGIYEDYGLAETSNANYSKIGLTFQCIHALPNAYKFSEAPVNSWYYSGLKTSLEGCKEQLCDPLKNLIKNKFSFNNSTRSVSWYASSSYEGLFLPSYSELWAKDKDTTIAPYDWYNNGRDEEGNIIFDPNDRTKLLTEGCCFSWAWQEKISGANNNEKFRYLSVCNDGGLPANADMRGCWLRSVDSASSDKSFYIDLNGRIDCLETYDKYLCVAPCFCLGV